MFYDLALFKLLGYFITEWKLMSIIFVYELLECDKF